MAGTGAGLKFDGKVTMDAQVDAGFKTNTRSVNKVTNFELLTTRAANGTSSSTQSCNPVEAATLGPPVDVPLVETFATTTIGIYIAPRVVLTSFLGSLNLLSFKMRGGLDVEDEARAMPAPMCINYTVKGVLRTYYRSPLISLAVGEITDDFKEIFAVSKLIVEQKGCLGIARGNFVGHVRGNTTFRNIGRAQRPRFRVDG